MRLIIAEKPSVAHSIAAVIEATERRDGYMEGNSYLVSWYPLPTLATMTGDQKVAL